MNTFDMEMIWGRFVDGEISQEDCNYNQIKIKSKKL